MRSAPPGRADRWLAGFTLLALPYVFLVANWQIYTARHAFIRNHPDYVARQPPTISRAISDPVIGVDFAFWITSIAILLPPAMYGVGRLFQDSSAALTGRSPQLSRSLRLFVPVVVPLQVVASVGLVLLSHFRFPTHNDLHMLGSYLFFPAQALVVGAGASLCLRLARDPGARAALAQARGLLNPSLSRLRAWIGNAMSVLALLYGALFVLKDFDLPMGGRTVYAAYVLAEPVLITGFLTYIIIFMPELAARLRTGAQIPVKRAGQEGDGGR